MSADLTSLATATLEDATLPPSPSSFLTLVAANDEHKSAPSRGNSSSVTLTGEFIANMAIADGAECFTDQLGKAWVWLPSLTPSPHRETLRLESRAFLRKLSALIEWRPDISEKPTKSLLRKAVELLDLSALTATERSLHTRLTWEDGAIYIDRVEGDWKVIRVTTSGWSEETPAHPRFYRTAHQRELPAPLSESGGLSQWCAIINYGLVLTWFLPVAFTRERLYSLWGRWFRLSAEQFDALSFIGIGIYKVGILLFNVVPYIALSIAD